MIISQFLTLNFYIRVVITNQNDDITIKNNIEDSLLMNYFLLAQLINKKVTNKKSLN